MEAYQQRVVDEKKKLQSGIEKLTVFINSDFFDTLSDEDAALLSSQLAVMNVYDRILERRIARFGEKG